jgi:hypothetical protein
VGQRDVDMNVDASFFARGDIDDPCGHHGTQTDADETASADSGDSFDPAWHQLLQTCPRDQAQKATVIRRALKAQLGNWQAAALLSNYREATLRLPGRGCCRLIVDCRGAAMRLALDGSSPQAAAVA